MSTPNHGQLTYIAKNCGEQNKNMCVARFCMWLVEAIILPKAILLLLVKIHTKNSSDHMFNLLKLTYHCRYSNGQKIRGWLSTPNHGQLTYIAKNCGEQNKNMCVARFCMWLVEAIILPKAILLLVVKIHTKTLPVTCSTF